MIVENINLVDSYFKLLKNLSSANKISLIEQLAHSLQEKKPEEQDVTLNNFFGAFVSHQTAEEIIEDIKRSRTFNRNTDTL